ncbi:helix-turn-helix domain-containing protein [Marinilactibacillus psychrotolerans]|uniref:helix-turn-helix domain-containing protein n=1 Tax=Marinilactibacillus psychrotolerans TaxID=191770 RepID=UPI003888F9C9
MKSTVVNKEVRAALTRNNYSQKELARKTNRAATTISGYLNTEPTPPDAMLDIAEAMNDSVLSQDFSYMLLGQFPAMESDVFQENVHAYAIIQDFEESEREQYEQAAKMALTKNKEHLDKQDKDALWNYGMNFLDEIFVEMRYVISIFSLLDMSLMQAIKKRRSLWVSKRYLKS